jgi:hypothetical protein
MILLYCFDISKYILTISLLQSPCIFAVFEVSPQQNFPLSNPSLNDTSPTLIERIHHHVATQQLEGADPGARSVSCRYHLRWVVRDGLEASADSVGWGNSEGSGLFSMASYQRRFGECDAAGICALSTTRQSAITGLLSVGAVIGAVGSGSIAARVSIAHPYHRAQADPPVRFA